MTHSAQLTISRPVYSNGKKKISIKVRDNEARIEFLRIQIDLDKFTECLTGLAYVECDMEVHSLDKINKQEERKPLIFKMPSGSNAWNKEIAVARAIEHTPEGWTPSLYFGSPSSFFTKDGKPYAKTYISRWVEK